MEKPPLVTAHSLDPVACYRAIQARDPRFDGRMFVGVTSTGIYCRPICPARTPNPENCRFFPSAAAAHGAGFRPCLRCRPEIAPELPAGTGSAAIVSRALMLIATGALDDEDGGVEALATRIGVGGRQLRRLFRCHLGASPVAVAQTRRVLFAKQLIQETRLPMTDVALAAGFGSIRRFNETFHDLFGRPPSALRRRTAVAAPAGSVLDPGVTLRLRYRPPYDWPAMLEGLGSRAIAGVEQVGNDVYRRTVAGDGLLGTVEVRHEPTRHDLVVSIRTSSVRALPAILGRVRRVFDVDADIAAIGAHLAEDPLLAPLIARRPGLRAPGGWDGFELAVRAILGQQVSVETARRLAGQLVALCGEPLPAVAVRWPGVSHAFPTPERVAAADLAQLGMPAARRTALAALATAATADRDLFHPSASPEDELSRLRAIPGVGDWTAQVIALRVLRDPDAFPVGDFGLRHGTALTAEELRQRAERWRPWRAYAAQHLWAADGDLELS